MAVLPSKIEPRSQHTMGRSAISTKFRRIIVPKYNTAARHECISEQKVGSMGWILERYFRTKSGLDRWVASMCCDRQDCGRPWGAAFDLELAAEAFVLPFAEHREKYTVKNNRSQVTFSDTLIPLSLSSNFGTQRHGLFYSEMSSSPTYSQGVRRGT